MSALVAGIVLALAVAAAASLLARMTVRGALGVCLAGQMCAMLVRLAGLGGIALLVHLRWPQDLIVGLAGAALVLIGGLALDARHLLRTLRTPTEERVRA
jgi:hypothetical protein